MGVQFIFETSRSTNTGSLIYKIIFQFCYFYLNNIHALRAVDVRICLAQTNQGYTISAESYDFCPHLRKFYILDFTLSHRHTFENIKIPYTNCSFNFHSLSEEKHSCFTIIIKVYNQQTRAKPGAALRTPLFTSLGDPLVSHSFIVPPCPTVKDSSPSYKRNV